MASLIWFVSKEEKDKARKALELIAKAYIAKCAREKLDIELLFFISCKGCDGGRVRDDIKSIIDLQHEDSLTIVDFPQRQVRCS